MYRQRRRLLSSTQSRPPSPTNVVQAGISAVILSWASPEPVAGPSRILTRIDDSQTMDESVNERPENTPNLQRPIAMFSGIHQVHITGGKFIQNNGYRDESILKHAAFQSLPRSYDAAFCAAINIDNLARRPCTHGTRVDIISQIAAWVDETNPARAPPVYWLTGLAGLGKTTIAYTICKLLDEAQLPFASFFCSLQLDSRSSKLIIPTMCRDLAEIYSAYAANVLSTLATNSKVVHAGLRIQIDELLAKPWQASITQRSDRKIPTPVVVVDALDESDRGSEFLQELLHVIHAGQLAGIKFLVTSRPDPKIVDICKSFPPNAICKLHEVDPANVQYDIEKYLREALPKLKDEPELALLSQRAGGFFIYATTAVRFISPPRSPPSVSEMRSHLRTILNAELLASRDERLLVDELYERILGDAFWDARVRATRLRILHAIVCAASSIDMSLLADLTNTDQETVKIVVESLHAVLFVSPKDGCVYWYHASFPEFVFSQARAKIGNSARPNQLFDVFCYPPSYHGVLARRCFSIMQESLHFNMCNLPSSYLFDSEVPGLNASIDEAFSPTLRYVSRHWTGHLRQAVPAKDDTDDLICRLKEFLCNRLLFWIEAMNLIGAKSECPSLLRDIESWAERGMGWPDLLAELTDATNFSAFFAGSPASRSTPHLYISALSMWNQHSAIWRNWRDRFAFIPSISLPRATITIPLMTIRTTDPVLCIIFSPDGDRIVSGSFDGSVRVWDARTGEQLMELQRHTDWVSSVAFSPDGNRIVSGSGDTSVRVWDAKTGEQLRVLRGHTERVISVAFSPDGNQILSGSSDKSVRVWDAKTGEQLRKLQGHTAGVSSVAFSPDGNRIASGSSDKSVRVWDAKTGEQVRVLRGHTEVVISVAFSPDGNQILSGSFDKSVRVWDAKTGEQLQELQELQGHTAGVSSVAFSPDGNRIVSGSSDSVRVWDIKTSEQVRELRGHTELVMSVAFSPDGNQILSGSFDESVRVWAVKTGEQLRELQGHTAGVVSVTFSPDGNRIASGSCDTSVGVWDAKTGEQVRELQGHTLAVNSVAFSPGGDRIVSGSDDMSVRVWDAKTGEQMRELQRHKYGVNSVSFSPGGDRIVSDSSDMSVQVWDAKTGERLRELQGHRAGVVSVTFSPDGNRIASGSWDTSVRVWDAKTGEQVRVLRGHTLAVHSVAFSPGGDRIVSGSNDNSVRVWDVKTGEQVRELQGHTRRVVSVAFSPCGDRIVSGSFDKSVRVWDANTGEQLRQLQGHTDDVASVAFSTDGNRIVSGSSDKSVRVWDHLNLDAPWVLREDGWILR